MEDKHFIVWKREVNAVPVRIKAQSAKAAITKVEDGEGKIEYDHMEFSHTLDSSEWQVEEEDEPPCYM